MWNMDPIHWVAAGSLVVNVIFGGYTYILDLKIDACEASHNATEVLGKAQEAETKRKNKESAVNQKEANKFYETTIARNNADINRLRKQIARSSVLPSTPQLCTEGTKRTSIDWPFIEQAVRDYRQRVGELIEKGDHCIAGLDTVKNWYEEERD